MRIDDEGSQQWYETVSDESGVRFTGLASHPSWDALLATGQTLNRGRAYLASTSGGSIDQLYEQDTDGLLADVTGTSIGAALLNGSNDDQNNDPFAASIAVDPSEDDVTLSIDPVAPAVGESIRASVAVDGQWTPASIEWSGDVDGSGESIETSFDEAGSYIIAVAVSNEVGGQVRLEESVSVGEADGDGSGGDDDGLPGFGVPAALAGVAGGLGLAYGRKRLQDQSTAEE